MQHKAKSQSKIYASKHGAQPGNLPVPSAVSVDWFMVSDLNTSVVVQARTWFEARALARVELQRDEVAWHPTPTATATAFAMPTKGSGDE